MVRFIFSDGNEGDGSLWTAFVAMIIMSLYFLFVAKEKPYKYKRNNSLQNVMALANLFICFCGIMFLNAILSVEGREIIYCM
jgi:hypothetical protein